MYPPLPPPRRLCSQLPDVWTTTSSPEETLLALVRDICVYCLKHSAEAEACDLLMEVEKVELIGELVSEDIYERVCLYLTRWGGLDVNHQCTVHVYII